MTTMRAATALLMLLSSASATVAQIQELQRSEWPAQVNLDVSDNIRDCEAAGGRLVRARNYACYISPEDCMRKGDNWKVVRRPMVTVGSATIVACHRMQ